MMARIKKNGVIIIRKLHKMREDFLIIMNKKNSMKSKIGPTISFNKRLFAI